jgi:hypothetical protein
MFEFLVAILAFIIGCAIYHWGRVNGNKPGYRLIQELAASAEYPAKLRQIAQSARITLAKPPK